MNIFEFIESVNSIEVDLSYDESLKKWNHKPRSHRWGYSTKKHSEIKDAEFFGIITNSFPENYSVIDVDVKNGLDVLNTEEMKLYNALKSLSNKTFTEYSKSNKGGLHIYVNNDLRIFKKNAFSLENLSIEIYSKTDGSNNGYFIIPTLNAVSDVREVAEIPNIIKGFSSLGFDKRVVNNDNFTAINELDSVVLNHLEEYSRLDDKVIEKISKNLRNDDLHYDDYFTIACAFHSASKGSSFGYKCFIEWASKSKKYNANNYAETFELWERIKLPSYRSKSITTGSLVYFAEREGIEIYEAEKKPVLIKSFHEMPDFIDCLGLCKEIDSVVKFNPSATLYAFLSSVSGSLGRCFRVYNERTLIDGTLSFCSMYGAESGKGKSMLLDIFKEPFSNHIMKEKKIFSEKVAQYKRDFKKYQKDIAEYYDNNIDDESLKPREPNRPIDPVCMSGNISPNGFRRVISTTCGNFFLVTAEFKSMFGQFKKDINDWTAVICKAWSGDGENKITGIMDCVYDGNPYTSLSYCAFDQPDTLEEFLSQRVVRNDGLMGRSFIDFDDDTKSTFYDENKRIDRKNKLYLDYCNFVEFFLKIQNEMAYREEKPIVIKIGKSAKDVFNELKLFIDKLMADKTTYAYNIKSMLFRTVENCIRIFCLVSLYKDFSILSDQEKLKKLNEYSNNSVMFDDVEIATFCKDVCLYNIKRNTELILKVLEYEDSDFSRVHDAVQGSLKSRNNSKFTFANVMRWGGVRDALSRLENMRSVDKKSLVLASLNKLVKDEYILDHKEFYIKK